MRRKTIPRHRSEDREREFWAENDSVDYMDWSKGERVRFSYVRPSPKAPPRER